MSHPYLIELPRLAKMITIALALAWLTTLGQSADLPPRSAQFLQRVEQLKAHIEQVDQRAEQLRAPEFPTGKDW
ncbi:uncharacterized protein METZ01_LOCUS483752, partial [marine metagenome]